jgi:hypothetical protein
MKYFVDSCEEGRPMPITIDLDKRIPCDTGYRSSKNLAFIFRVLCLPNSVFAALYGTALKQWAIPKLFSAFTRWYLANPHWKRGEPFIYALPGPINELQETSE